ncbi:hypothetical protein GALMADRAFT_731294 [Galerina marginata CBS 339.88]|uniref:Uncharacterized protein n=1 Tax=Galerina marginata (strain CBS 339.88) TaxID=685588 RepID=A0A067SR57_GALM3|nr:hypothetical protein GALMADRAFT_731294 [Galerina marginata CBS 339.88]
MRDVGRNCEVNEGLVSGNTPALVNATPRFAAALQQRHISAPAVAYRPAAGVASVREEPASPSLTVMDMVDDATVPSHPRGRRARSCVLTPPAVFVAVNAPAGKQHGLI